MNCRRIEKLIPLFVEGDLDVAAMNEVSLHLNDCQNCSQLMGEYGESQNWLRTFTPPEFDSAFFVDLKQSVMQEIGRKPTRPTWIHRLVERWSWNPTWAMAIVMLVLVGGLAFYLYSGKIKSDLPHEIITKESPKPHPQELREDKPQPKRDEDKNPKSLRAVRYSQKRLPSGQLKKTDEKLPVAIHQKTEPLESLAVNIFDDAVETNSIDFGGVRDLPPASESTRIEFQTIDPNIRIIWFAPKPNHLQSSKTDTD
jgi:hypothetical protein